MNDNENKTVSTYNFLKNKEIIIAIILTVLVVVVCFYFYRKNRELSTKIDIIAKKFEEQQELLAKHDEMMGHLVQTAQRQQTIIEQLAIEKSYYKAQNPKTPESHKSNPSGNPNKLFERTQPIRPFDTTSEINTKSPSIQPSLNINNTSSRHISFKEPVEQISPPVKDIEDIEEESESELEDDENLDAELEEELKELKEMEEENKKN